MKIVGVNIRRLRLKIGDPGQQPALYPPRFGECIGMEWNA